MYPLLCSSKRLKAKPAFYHALAQKHRMSVGEAEGFEMVNT